MLQCEAQYLWPDEAIGNWRKVGKGGRKGSTCPASWTKLTSTVLVGRMAGKMKGEGNLTCYSDGLCLPRYFKGTSRALSAHRRRFKTMQYSVLKLLQKFLVLMPFWRAGETQQKFIFQWLKVDFPWEFYWTKDPDGMFGRLLVHEVCSTNKRAYTREE